MRVADDVAVLLQGSPNVNSDEQGFLFLTVDVKGFPHTALLSRAELDVPPDGSEVLASIASPLTCANLRQERLAGLLAISDTTAHHLKLHLLRTVEVEGVLGAAFQVIDHKRDSIGIPLRPIGFRASAHVALLEHWDLSRRVLGEVRREGTA